MALFWQSSGQNLLKSLCRLPKISADMCEVKKHRLGQMRLGAVGAQPALHKKPTSPLTLLMHAGFAPFANKKQFRVN